MLDNTALYIVRFKISRIEPMGSFTTHKKKYDYF